ncbi:MAG TPA: glutamate cyclase domain-containing protein [Acidimicrobiia bacterium]|nr:glutamate cyclase domain-containing protein [Acidimicrobiia bacterium]
MTTDLATYEMLDTLLTVDLPARGVIDIAYPLFREHYGRPLFGIAAELLMDAVAPGDTVVIATGFPNRTRIDPTIAESDGPVGAASMARAFEIGLGAAPVILVEDSIVAGAVAAVQALGMKSVTPEQAVASARSASNLHAVAVLASPLDAGEARHLAERLSATNRVAAFVAIEKGGANAAGEIHYSRGTRGTPWVAPLDPVMEVFETHGAISIGIGDGGNEIGMGNADGALREVLPYGADCGCPCRLGIVPARQTDLVLPVTVSNWGGYGVSAALSFALDDPRLLHHADSEARMLRAAGLAGLIDGVSGFTEPTSDGLSEAVHTSIVDLLHAIVGRGVHRGAWPRGQSASAQASDKAEIRTRPEKPPI